MSTTIDLMLDQLQASHLIHPLAEPELSFIFNHVLTQEAAYHSLLVRNRREYHLLIASVFEQVYAERLDECIPTLAYHYWRAEDWPRAARYAHLAADRALQVYALREAMAYYVQALQALDRTPNATPTAICDLILGWAQAAFAFEPYSKQLEWLARAEQIARQIADKRRLALALHSTGKVHVASGYALRATAPLVECFALATELGEEKLSVIPTFYMGAATYDSDPRGALTWFERAIELARKHHDIEIEAYALALKAMVEARLGEVNDSRQDLQQAIDIVPQIKSPMCDSDVHLFSAWAMMDLGDVHRGLEYAKLGVEKAVSANNMECACFAFACLGFGHLRSEQMGEAVQAFEEAIRRSKYSGAEPSQILGEMGLGMARFISGHPEGVQQIENAYAHAERIGEEFIGALLAQTLGEVYLQRDQVEPAVQYLTRALDYFRRHRMRRYLARTLELWAEALERQGEQVQAHEARLELAELVNV